MSRRSASSREPMQRARDVAELKSVERCGRWLGISKDRVVRPRPSLPRMQARSFRSSDYGLEEIADELVAVTANEGVGRSKRSALAPPARQRKTEAARRPSPGRP